MTTTQITNIADLLDLTDAAGDFLDDFDMDAVHADYLAEVNLSLPTGIDVLANGGVIADLDRADFAREIDWKELTDNIDVAPIFERHDRTAQLLANVAATKRSIHVAAVKAAKDSGRFTMDEIAKAAGITRDAVYKMLARAEQTAIADEQQEPNPMTETPNLPPHRVKLSEALRDLRASIEADRDAIQADIDAQAEQQERA